MLLVVAHFPAGQDVLARTADLCGLSQADVTGRLSGVLPRVLLRDANAGRIQDLVDSLRGLGVVAIACDPALVPKDSQRVLVRRLEPHPKGFVAVERNEARHVCAREGVRLLQRGVRVLTGSQTVRVTEKKFSLARAALTGGLMINKQVEREVSTETVERESFLLVQRDDGPEAIIYERRLDYRFLAGQMAPASAANLQRTWAWLKAAVPSATVDERVIRPGFVKGLPMAGTDPVDLALHLVWLACQVGYAGLQ